MKEGNTFLDTNVFIYSIDSENSFKQNIASELIKNSIISGTGFTSYQVVQEFLNVSGKNFKEKISHEQQVEFANAILFPMLRIFPSKKFFLDGLEIQERWKYSFYDSLIISAALAGDCDILYSEDLQHNQKIQDLTIRNPFLQ